LPATAHPRRTQSDQSSPTNQASDQRYARGEIDATEFEERKRTLGA
jgi:uncharacterized membrane protein